jgi:hypothetical protein
MSGAGKHQKIIRALGWFLAFVCIINILVYFILITNAMMNSLTLADFDFWTIPKIIKRTVIIIILFLLFVLAVCLSRHKKIVVLYLRKFHLNTNILSPKNNGGLGSKIRIVTLQDETFPSMASTRKDKLISYLVTIIIFIAAILFVWYLGTKNDPVVSEDNEFLIIAVYLSIGYAMWLCVALLIFMLFYIIIHSKNKVIQIAKPRDINTAGNKVTLQNLFIKRISFLGNKSIVIETLNYLWKETVSSLITKCNIAVIDITQLSENIMWEIKSCLSGNIPVILIYSEEKKAELAYSLDQLSLYLNDKSVLNVLTVDFPVTNDSRLTEFRNKLIKIITENFSYTKQRIPINTYYLKRLVIYFFLLMLSIVLSSLVTLLAGYNILEGVRS